MMRGRQFSGTDQLNIAAAGLGSVGRLWSIKWILSVMAAIAIFAVAAGVQAGIASTRPADTAPPPGAEGETHLPLTFNGGHDTDGVDRGRPVALIAAALGVKTDVFREAFRGVHPAGAGRGPTDQEARANKKALMAKLSPYGVTDDRLNEVSNFYRYNRQAGELWKHDDATGYAVVREGVVKSFVITDNGYGYTTPPTVAIATMPSAHLKADLSFGKDLTKNGSVKSVSLAAPAASPATAPATAPVTGPSNK